MKKALIAGAASTVLAAMPVVGVLALGTDVTMQRDDLEITVPDICSFGYTYPETNSTINVTGVAHASGSDTIYGTWANGDGSTTYDTLSVEMTNSTSSQNIGTTTLGVYCNSDAGYQITAGHAAALTGVTNGANPVAITDTIPVSSSFSASSTGWSYKVAKKTENSWTQNGDVMNVHTAWANATEVSEDETVTNPAANGVIAGSAAATLTTGDYYIITYGAGIDTTQSAGTYTGYITYTLAQLQPSGN